MPEAVCYAYHFEMHGIQRHIMEGGKLRDMAGGSALLDSVCRPDGNDLLECALLLLGESRPHFFRRAGGAFSFCTKDKDYIPRLRALWTLGVQAALPGAAFSDGTGESSSEGVAGEMEALGRAARNAKERRNLAPVRLPAAPPCAARAERTGDAAVRVRHEDRVSEATEVKRKAAERGGKALERRLTARFLPAGADARRYVFPVDMEGDAGEKDDEFFPFPSADRTVAVFHADGNGIGKKLAGLRERLEKSVGGTCDAYADFSKELAEAVERAAKRATGTLLGEGEKRDGKTVLPLRPVLLGGDDLTVILRADVALPFAVEFLEAFEEESAAAMRKLREGYGGDLFPEERLTAGGGLAFLQAKHPFSAAYALCEELAAAAKGAGKGSGGECGTLLFYRETASASRSYEGIVAEELSFMYNNTPHRISMGAYGVGEAARTAGLPHISDLKKLCDAAASRAGTVRRLLHMAVADPDEAMKYWGRFVGSLEGEESGGIDAAMQAFGVEKWKEWPFADKTVNGEEICVSPLLDVATLALIDERYDIKREASAA